MMLKSASFCIAAVCILFDHGLCDCNCHYFGYFLWDFGPIINISLNGSVDLVMYAVELGPYTCDDFKIFWEIVKADSQAEEYIVANEDHYGRHETLRDRGLSFDGFCRFECYQLLTVTPTDMRYNGAQITGVVNLPECFNTSNTTNTTTLWIQGLLEAPSDVRLETINVESVMVSWSPPFTLEGVPILHYSVYITSQGVSVQRNTTETNITLDRPCASTSYQITAWNEVGDGNSTMNVFFTITGAAVTALEKQSEPRVCLSCTFFADSTADGCAVKMQSNKHVFVFKATQNNMALLECVSVQEAGEYSVSVHEIHDGVVQEHISSLLKNVTVQISSLIHSAVEPVKGGICAFCVFTSNTTAKGCVIKLSSHQVKFDFNIIHLRTNDVVLQECFKVSQSGLYHVLVSDIQRNGSEGYDTLELPPITIVLDSDTTAEQVDGTSTVTGLSAVLSLTMLGLIVAVVIVLIQKRSAAMRKSKVATDSPDTTNPPSSATVTTTPLYENTEISPLPPPPPTSATDGGDNMYELVELRPITGQEKEIKVASNAAYGTVRR